MLEVSAASVNSALQRARGTMVGLSPDTAPLPRSAVERDLAERFAAAYTSDDISGLVALLTDDAWFTMPPSELEYQGRAAVAEFLTLSAQWRAGRQLLLVPTRANGQPAFGVYVPDGDVHRAHGLAVLSLRGDKISAVTRFVDTAVVSRFGLPRMLYQNDQLSPDK